MAPTRSALAAVALLLGFTPATAQELENSKTPVTSGTVGKATAGRTSGANLSAGDKGPASETTMSPQHPQTNRPGSGAAQAGASDTTKELFQH